MTAWKIVSWLISGNLNFGKVPSIVTMSCWGPQDKSQVRWFARRTDRIQHIVILMSVIYYSKRIRNKTSKGKRCKVGLLQLWKTRWTREHLLMQSTPLKLKSIWSLTNAKKKIKIQYLTIIKKLFSLRKFRKNMAVYLMVQNLKHSS